MNQLPIKYVVYAILALFVLLTLIWSFDVVTIKGNEVGVMETWTGGVQEESLKPKTYLALPWERIYPYTTAVQVFVMNDDPHDDDIGRQQDSYLVQSKDAQDMHLSLQVQWSVDPAHVVDLHKSVGEKGIEEKILRPIMLRVVKDESTTREAIAAYSGDGLVNLQQSIEQDLADPKGELATRGVLVQSFVIQGIRLDPNYVKEITGRQIAMVQESRAKQEEKAATAKAATAKAQAQELYERRVVEARTKKEEMVLAAEADNEKQILAAQAEKQKTVLAAEAKKESGELEAAAILAIGKATAEAERLKFAAFDAKGAERYVAIEVAKSFAQANSGIKGYLPENMTIYTLGENFSRAIESFMKINTAATAKQ